ncbi:coiled-coil-helix-coiled-coil-helix domain containing 3 [Calliopsis andreniformis]|uniref:coiled-coil-helix-coiled-coil-helix domain containing 3 n=1 Tax=Calliopsis andreniformis TaxID=337506 RepID=UPI003FCD1C67
MGAEQSTRKLTIDNEEIDVIKVSNSVVQRLAQKTNEAHGKSAAEVRPPTLSEPHTVSSQPPQSGTVPISSGYPVYYYPQLTLSALEIQKEKEKELHNQDLYWQNRIANLQKNHIKIDRIIDEEHKKAIEEFYVDGKKKVNNQDTVQPCLENTEKVLKCYQENPKEILKCSSLVEEFSNCVDQRRARIIAARC